MPGISFLRKETRPYLQWMYCTSEIQDKPRQDSLHLLRDICRMVERGLDIRR